MNFDKIRTKFIELSKTPSDINEHLDDLASLAKECSHVTEMGIRSCVSTWAFLYGKPEKLVSYDIHYHDNFEEVKQARPDWEVHVVDVLKVDIEPTDLLFIDTLHTYTQLKKELKKHGNKAKKYLVFHDTETYGYTPEPASWQTPEIMKNYKDNDKGLMPAINEFMDENPDWYIYKQKRNNNGLLILKRA